MLFAFVVLSSQMLENDTFSIDIDPCMRFHSSKVLKKMTLKISQKRIFTSSFVIRVPLTIEASMT